ncbi:MAG TPA: dTDP-4-dehydrorhamnose 3,5-epimerase family protein [Phycisphaerae bacterium]|nr:dTDP-4-dehydrorhamnose 3,5-epimerase family protein [Phycisphaerae bacterium]
MSREAGAAAAPRGEIDGVRVVPLKRIPDERGTILHMLRRSDGHFLGFGEVYFSTIYAGVIKGWHKHREMTLNYAVPVGRVKLVIYDDRAHSPTYGLIQEVFLGPDNYSLVQIPPGLWNGFKGMSRPLALLANCCTHVHDPSLTTRLAPFDPSIPYNWEVRHA